MINMYWTLVVEYLTIMYRCSPNDIKPLIRNELRTIIDSQPLDRHYLKAIIIMR